MAKVESVKTVLPEELVVAVFFKLRVWRTAFNQEKLVGYFDRAANKWGGIWNEFSKRRSGSSKFDEVVASLLHGGSLARDSGLETLYSTPHTLGPYGRSLYDGLSPILRENIDQLCGWIIRD